MKAAEQGDSDAQGLLAEIYKDGNGVEKNICTSNYWLIKSAENGNAVSQWKLGYRYISGEGLDKNPEKAYDLFLKSAEQGNCYGQLYAGDFCRLELKNYKDAAKWYRLGAEQGHPHCQCYLGVLCYWGSGVEKNLSEAAKWFQLSAEQGYALGQSNLADLYYIGEGVEQDYSEALRLFRLSAEQNNDFAFLRLGDMYESGAGVERDMSKAINYWERAFEESIEQKNARGEPVYKLGYAYYDGCGVERDLKKAKEYFEKAIEQGYHCSYALNMVKGELGELEDNNKMREYADGLIKKHIPNPKLYQQISKDLQNDFGDTWNITCRETKKFLETGMFTYFSLYSLGPHIYGNMDFSASITPMFKALEKELGKHLYSGYIEFLTKQDVSPNTFPQKRSFIKRISSTELAYRDSSDLTEFTLGNLHLTVGLERKAQFAENDTSKYMIDRQMFDYLNSIFKEDAFGEAKREREITDYIISLTQEVKAISDSLRNPAAHDRAMKIHKAEVCGNYIIKVQKLLFGFLSKLK